MTGTVRIRAIVLTLVVVVSMAATPIVFGGGATAAAKNMTIVGGQERYGGSGSVTVSFSVDSGASATLAVIGPDGAKSDEVTVADGGSGDDASASGQIETTLDLGALYDSPPASGQATVVAEQGTDSISVSGQSWTTKRQFLLDSSPPTATVIGSPRTGGSFTAAPGDQVKISYSIDENSGLSFASLALVGPDGSTVQSWSDLQAGQSREVQFVVGSSWPTGSYDIELRATDTVGQTSSDVMADGMTVESGSSGSGGDGSGGDGSSSSGGDGSGSTGGDTGGSAATASNVEIRSAQPVAASGTLTVSTSLSSAGADATFVVEGGNGNAISAAKTVTDGGTADESATSGVVKTTLDLDALFGSQQPASGQARVLAAGGTSLSVSKQTFDTKRQFQLDADVPSATIHGSPRDGGAVSGVAGDQLKLSYSLTDASALTSSSLRLVGPNGNTVKEWTGLESGPSREVQFVVGSSWPTGTYDVQLTATDAAGHTASASMAGGFVVGDRGSTVVATNPRIVDVPPVKGSGTVTVTAELKSQTGGNLTFAVEGPNGVLSDGKTVTDQGPADRAATAGVVRTTLDLGRLFTGQEASSGTARLLVAGGNAVNVASFDVKRQFQLDATPPTVRVLGGSNNAPRPAYVKPGNVATGDESGNTVQVYWNGTDVPQKFKNWTLTVRDPQGDLVTTRSGTDTQNQAQFHVDRSWAPGSYDLRVTIYDEVGHRATDTYEGGLVVDETEPAVGDAYLATTASADEGGKQIVLEFEYGPVDPETLTKEDLKVTADTSAYENVAGLGISNLKVTPDGRAIISVQLQGGENITEQTRNRFTLQSPSVKLNASEFIADRAGNQLAGPRWLAKNITDDDGPPQDPDEVYVYDGPISSDEASNVTVGVNFTRSMQGENGTVLVGDPPTSGTIYVRFTGPNGATVYRSMPANTAQSLSSGTFDLSGAPLADGTVEVRAKLVDTDGTTNPSGYDAPTFVEIDFPGGNTSGSVATAPSSMITAAGA